VASEVDLALEGVVDRFDPVVLAAGAEQDLRHRQAHSSASDSRFGWPGPRRPDGIT
jgi:hypothetical protein